MERGWCVKLRNLGYQSDYRYGLFRSRFRLRIAYKAWPAQHRTQPILKTRNGSVCARRSRYVRKYPRISQDFRIFLVQALRDVIRIGCVLSYPDPVCRRSWITYNRIQCALISFSTHTYALCPTCESFTMQTSPDMILTTRGQTGRSPMWRNS